MKLQASASQRARLGIDIIQIETERAAPSIGRGVEGTERLHFSGAGECRGPGPTLAGHSAVIIRVDHQGDDQFYDDSRYVLSVMQSERPAHSPEDPGSKREAQSHARNLTGRMFLTLLVGSPHLGQLLG